MPLWLIVSLGVVSVLCVAAIAAYLMNRLNHP